MEKYDKLVEKLVAKLDGDDEDVIFATLALFTLEWKYNVELFYNCAVEAEKNNIKEVFSYNNFVTSSVIYTSYNVISLPFVMLGMKKYFSEEKALNTRFP